MRNPGLWEIPSCNRERETGIEPATPSLARRCSTAEPLAQSIYNPRPLTVKAGDGNRTHVSSLEGWCSTIELHPQTEATINYLSQHWLFYMPRPGLSIPFPIFFKKFHENGLSRVQLRIRHHPVLAVALSVIQVIVRMGDGVVDGVAAPMQRHADGKGTAYGLFPGLKGKTACLLYTSPSPRDTR